MSVIDLGTCYHRHEVEVHNLSFDGGQDASDPYGYYYCRMRCGLMFKTKATRNRYDYLDNDFMPSHITVKKISIKNISQLCEKIIT